MKRIRLYIMSLLGLLLTTACGGGGGNDSVPSNSFNGGGGTTVPKIYYQTVTIPAEGGTHTITLSDLNVSVTSISSTPEWIVISPEYYTSGTPTIKLEVKPNTNTIGRECTVTILAASGEKVQLTVKQQAAAAPTYGIEDAHDEQSDNPAFSPRR